MIELHLLADELEVSERTLRRAVTRGTLRGVRPSPRVLEMPMTERRYVRRSWPMLAALRGALRTEHNVRFALLFGSAATGTDTSTSDVDILVEMRDSGLDRVVDLSTKLTAAVGRRVDVIRLDDAEADSSFLADAVANGRVLVDRDGSWPRLRGREARLRRRRSGQEADRACAALAGLDRLLAS